MREYQFCDDFRRNPMYNGRLLPQTIKKLEKIIQQIEALKKNRAIITIKTKPPSIKIPCNGAPIKNCS
jgi:hypothetical protein